MSAMDVERYIILFCTISQSVKKFDREKKEKIHDYASVSRNSLITILYW